MHRRTRRRVQLGEVMIGGAVSRVEASQHPGLPARRLGDGLHRLAGLRAVRRPGPARSTPAMPRSVARAGRARHAGLHRLHGPARHRPAEGRARRWWWRRPRGAVGSVVGQIAKLKGCRVVGIAGGADKCRYVVEELGFDACLDHRSADLRRSKLAAACPKGIDVYFENVGGAVFDAVLPLLNTQARVPVCGLIAGYNAEQLPEGPDRLPVLTRTMLGQAHPHAGLHRLRRLRPRLARVPRADAHLGGRGQGQVPRGRGDGLENAPQAFIGLLEGRELRQAGGEGGGGVRGRSIPTNQ